MRARPRPSDRRARPHAARTHVSAAGRFDTDGWRSEGVDHRVEIDGGLSSEQRAAMLAAVDEVAEILRARRLGAPAARRRPPEPVP